MAVVHTRCRDFLWPVDSQASQAHLLGCYEPYMQEALALHSKAGGVVFDIGAHVGFHSLCAARLVGETGLVVAFEPSPRNQSALRRRLALNPWARVLTLPFAIGDRAGRARFDPSEDDSQGRLSPDGGCEVETETLDALVLSGRIPAPDVVKIDVEGHEGEVIQGAIGTLKKSRPVLLCDWNDQSTLEALGKILGPLDYRLSAGPPIVARPLGGPTVL